MYISYMLANSYLINNLESVKKMPKRNCIDLVSHTYKY